MGKPMENKIPAVLKDGQLEVSSGLSSNVAYVEKTDTLVIGGTEFNRVK
jgi:hypothetical protein